MISGFKHNRRGTESCLRSEESGYVAWQSHLHAGFGQRFQNDVDVRGAAGGKSGDCVHVLFVDDHRSAHHVEQS